MAGISTMNSFMRTIITKPIKTRMMSNGKFSPLGIRLLMEK